MLKYLVRRPSILNPATIILLTKTTAAQNGVALSCHKVRGLYFLAVASMRSIFLSSVTISSTVYIVIYIVILCK